MKNRLSAVWPIVNEYMEKAQRTQSRAYDKSATPRDFAMGEGEALRGNGKGLTGQLPHQATGQENDGPSLSHQRVIDALLQARRDQTLLPEQSR